MTRLISTFAGFAIWAKDVCPVHGSCEISLFFLQSVVFSILSQVSGRLILG